VPRTVHGRPVFGGHPRRGSFDQAEPANLQEFNAGRSRQWLGHRLILAHRALQERRLPPGAGRPVTW
ncbi:hypothetical protein, partial [Streptomyces sp.]|uniref:hypothetical protein n=1 Tax=Streptomyces sp. TaxID=1931 RepID=UPI002F3F1104